MSEKPSVIKRIFKSLWVFLNTSRKVFLNLVFFIFVIFLISIITDDSDQVQVANTTALVLNPKGDIVEQKREIDPADQIMQQAFGQQEENPEILLSDLLMVIEHAKTDDRVKTMVIYPQNLQRAGFHHLQVIGDAINDFKESGKDVVAFGDYFSQGQYYLASYADKVWMNPEGAVMLEGFGRYRTYFKSALDKLNITQHVFKVGTYKSAVEPYIRDDMSDAAKEANKAWLQQLWHNFKLDIAENRNLDLANFDETAEQLYTKLQQADGSFGEYALQTGLIDELRNREQIRTDMIAKVGKASKHDSFSQISFKEYLTTVKPPVAMVNPMSDKVAVIVAKGTILNGNQKAGSIGGDSTAKLLRKARLDDKVKAVVLRVDSPGGSAYASEIIRQEVELIKAAGKPVIASMANYAASGGYWISASANEIWASPNTITGSIGIFGMFMTFEKALDKVGVHTDGIGTTEFAGFGVSRPLPENIGNIIQLGIERGYKEFLTLVAENRNMTLEQVDAVAQGRVWTGAKAQELGLVDKLGGLDDAIAAAADRAGLKNYDVLLVEKELSPRQMFIRNLFENAQVLLPEATSKFEQAANNPSLKQRIMTMINEYEQMNQLNDPRGIYSFCLTCEAEF
ncbi:signal peptide peptidase SppA [Thalassotalea sp. HSM 43]|uniref:signal peptide peptidase SppA n=1 Tax=Thalassotalea sp. HSM 43 TaxID=2552945 RepID=UPI0010800E03|nr:signal peptide peptidase SppA [Thalassotalea sp. HSM 43]QBY06046.1 signal peptide peptidase SppA [Thalassotalea sp. HSM 43]